MIRGMVVYPADTAEDDPEGLDSFEVYLFPTTALRMVLDILTHLADPHRPEGMFRVDLTGTFIEKEDVEVGR